MRSKKRVWIINQYTSTPKLGGGGNRSYHIASELLKKDYDVTLITSSFSHVPKRNYPVDATFQYEKEGDLDLVIVDNIVYESGRSIKRIFSMLVFWFKLYRLPIRKLDEPDHIIVSSISLLPILNALRWKTKWKGRPKVILEIRDIWPMSLLELGSFSKWNPFVMFLAWVERKGYRQSDYLTSVLPAADKHFATIVGDDLKFAHISNGIHDDVIHNQDKIDDDLLAKIPKDKFIVGYSGSIGEANAMEYLIDAARLLQKSNICFVIVGDGHKKEELVLQAKGMDHIVFHGFIAKTQVQDFLSYCDLLFLGSRDTPLYRFGVSANKIFDYMLASKPILMTGKVPLNEIEIANCGKMIDPDDPVKIKEAILEFSRMNIESRNEMGSRGHDFVLDHRTYNRLAEKYISVFKELENNN